MESAQIQRWKGELHLFQTRCINESIGALYAGSRFTGEQRSGRCNYSVKVEIQHVDLRQSTLCGYLHIQGLTSENPELTTFFDAEIIGPRYSFLTRKWDAKEQIDRQHWNKFPAWRVYDSTFNDDGFEYTWKNKDYIFMRWKEHFLLPDHRIQTITGASFAGFYYICYQISTGVITGFYYHKNSEWYQYLMLHHAPEKTSPTFEFR